MAAFVANGKMDQANFVQVSKVLLELEDIKTVGNYQSLNMTNTQLILDDKQDREDGNILYHIDVSSIATISANILNVDDRIQVKDVTRLRTYTGNIVKISTHQISFTLSRVIRLNTSFNIDFTPDRQQFFYQYKALENISRNLKEFLFPVEKVDFLLPSNKTYRPFNKTIDKIAEQKEIVQNIAFGEGGLHCPFILLGPPGTGKTTTLVEAILQIYDNCESCRILVASESNTACNEIAERVLNHLTDRRKKDLIRIFSKTSSEKIHRDEILFKNSNGEICSQKHFYPSKQYLKEHYKIIVTTNFMLGKYC